MRVKVSFSKSNNTFAVTQYDSDGSVGIGTLRETDTEYWTDLYIDLDFHDEVMMNEEFFGDSA